ncbi:MAG TPA: chemotaxis protein CheB [Anaerolineaceae bacterium]|nr:chemotaxis protein CheB [Anaerolineaceae bacterium]
MAQDADHFLGPEGTENDNSRETSQQEAAPQDKPASEFPIVGIGASAGGLAAFERLFKALPPDSGVAFVVIQHLSPPHKSILPEILQRFTTMPVAQVTEGVEVEPNNVYVIPPGSDLALQDGHLRLLKPEKERAYRLPIDFFFRSLAQVQGAHAIGIVLSGTGSDGSLGLKTIKAEGGLTIAQDPETADFVDMPKNAIASKQIDFILPPEKMGDLILKYIHHQILDGYKRGESEYQIPVDGLQNLFYLLRSKTGHDFSQYKQNTLERRIERRMKICMVKDLDAYLNHLEEHPEEVEALFQEMLIHVTHFFREPEAYQALAEKVVRPLIFQKHAAHVPLRVWVAGCSSGEEAYSIAITLQEQIEDMKTDCSVQIFATDLDIDAIMAARRGFYSDGSLENVSPERLRRFFHQGEDGYQIKQTIRDMVVFSTQNLISDPPFSKIDLLTCRNVLIYMERELQNQLFLQFHYSLNPNGCLFLGNSESIGGNNDLFAEIDRKYKLFQRKEVPTQRLLQRRKRPFYQNSVLPVPGTRLNPDKDGSLRVLTEKALLEFHTPACVIIDPKHNVLFIHGRTGKYLEPVPGETNANLIRMAREGLKSELATAIHSVVTHHEMVRREGISVKTNGDYQPINLTVRLVQGPPDLGELIMVVFEEAQIPPQSEMALTVSDAELKGIKGDANSMVEHLRRELKEKDEYLHSIIDELEDINQDLKSSNEELQSTSEEMQSTNEELETSKEELQSINEELNTINGELQSKNEELSAINNDFFNLLASIEIGMIFLDLDLKIRRFTPAVNRFYNFLPADVGRSFIHFVSSLSYDHLVQDIHQVLHDLVPKAIEAQTKDGTWYLINIRPYRTLENVIDGVVITFVDISEQKHGDALRRMGTILRDSNDAVSAQDFNGKILAWNRGATRMYGWSEAAAINMNVLNLVPKEQHAELINLYQKLAAGEEIDSFETQRVTRDGQVINVWATLTSLTDDTGHPIAVATTERDISVRKSVEQQLSFENRALKALRNWHEALLDHPEHPTLAEEACSILVKKAGYRMAWIGVVAEGEVKTVRPIAWAGFENGGLGPMENAWQASIGSALSSKQPVTVRNVMDNLSQADEIAAAREYRYGSYLVLPLIHPGTPQGVLAVYAAEPDAFRDMEVDILEMLSERVI